MRTIRVLTCVTFILGIAIGGYAQNVGGKPARYSYTMVRLDSSWDAKTDAKLARYVARQKAKLDKQMGVVIGHCQETMNSAPPQSPLSNFLTDLLLEKGTDYVQSEDFPRCDIALLNFGGIRSQLSAGDIHVGDIYSLSPFDNYLVFIELKGSELRKALERFKPLTQNAPFAGAQMTFQGGKPVRILIGGEPLRDDRIYRLVTLNFISEGGDNILQGVEYERVLYTPVVFRNFLIREIKKMSKPVTATEDDRVILK